MGQPSVKWGQVRRYFKRRNYEIYGSGGDKIIVAPKDSDAARSRQTVLIGHKCCSHAGDEVWPSYLQAIRRAFGVSARDIVND